MNRKKKKREIILISRHGRRINKQTRCSACREIKMPVWRYPDSTAGVVFICAACKPTIFDESFEEKRDALDFAVSGGHFESNRRRH